MTSSAALDPSSLALPAQRRVCAVFADVVDSTGLAHRLGLLDYAEVMTEALQVLMLACGARGGEVLTHQGDAVVALWPEDHVEFALACAMELHPRLEALRVAVRHGECLRLRVGLAAGDVLLSLVGGSLTAYGLPVNLARRLCDAAPPGQSFACASVRELGTRAGWGPEAALRPRGFAPIRAFPLAFSPFDPHMKIS